MSGLLNTLPDAASLLCAVDPNAPDVDGNGVVASLGVCAVESDVFAVACLSCSFNDALSSAGAVAAAADVPPAY